MSGRIRSGLTLVLFLVALVPAAQAQAPFTVDPIHSTVLFRVKHLNTSYIHGRFNEVSGTFAIDKADPSKSDLRVEINTNSVDSGNAKRDQHLRGPDFFNVKQFPTCSFKSTAVRASGDNKLEVTGDFKLNGVTKSITVPIEVVGEGATPFQDYRMGVEAVFTIKRGDFGMKYMIGPLSDEVRITVNLEGARK